MSLLIMADASEPVPVLRGHAGRGRLLYVLWAVRVLLPQIRPAFLRPPLALFEPPGRDRGMIAAEQHVGNGHSAELPRSGLLGKIQQTLGETLVGRDRKSVV